MTLQPEAVYDTTPSTWHTITAALHDSVTRVLSLLVSILPGLLAFILAVALLTALGIFLSFLLRKILTSLKFDDRVTARTNWSPEQSPTALAGRATFWACVLLGLIVGTLSFDASYAAGSTLTLTLLPYLSHTVGAILILFFGNLIARFLARTVLIGAVNNQFQYARFLSLGVKWLVIVLTAAMVLEHLQIGGTVIALAFGILFGGIVLTLALAIGLGSRDLVSRSLARTTETLIPTAPPPPNQPPRNPPPLLITPGWLPQATRQSSCRRHNQSGLPGNQQRTPPWNPAPLFLVNPPTLCKTPKPRPNRGNRPRK